ncbi:hypothetical protein OEZ86_003671 [Tetradesmus obliquus]|nr:hypothetical protein OEZ86_003671 [Tetradesmus obliquus]
MAEELPQEALVRVFHFLPIKQRSRFACVCQSWRQASTVDAVQVKLQKQHVPSYLHVALPDGAAQMQAAACPLMSLARSADLTWSSAAATGTLLESMPSLERLAFTSMSSVPQPVDSSSGLQSLKSLTNLQSLQLNTSDAAPLLEAMPSVPHSVREIELHLTGEDWQTSALDKIADQLGSQATRLRSLVLRCSHASVYAATEPLESLSRLTRLTSLFMGPNPEDIFPHSSPLGFPRLPNFLRGLQHLQHLDISVADSAAAASLPGMGFDPIRHIPDVKLTLRADTSIRAVSRLPASIAAVAGLSSLTVQAFTFEDPGGWCTSANFDLAPLQSCKKLRYLELQLGTWECEHCETFELPGLQELSQLQSLKVLITSRFVSLGKPGPDSAAQVQEVLLALPGMRPAQQLHIASSMRVVLRNSKVLARAADPGVLAHSILLEEPLPQRKAAATAAAGTNPAGTQQQQPGSSSTAMSDTARVRDQAGPAAAPSSSSAAALGQAGQPQYVRAPAHVVISALRDLWPGAEVWQYPMKVPGVSSWRQITPELLCKVSARDVVQQQLWQQLVGAAGSSDLEDAEGSTAGRGSSSGMRLW